MPPTFWELGVLEPPARSSAVCRRCSAQLELLHATSVHYNYSIDDYNPKATASVAMRPTLRLLAAVKPGRYLEAGNPTGLTGLFTHPSPRSHLLFLYGSILQKLKSFPESSVYRQSTEALTKHRMDIIRHIKPAGYEEWQKRAEEKMKEHPKMFEPGNLRYKGTQVGENFFVESGGQPYTDEVEWDGEDGRVTKEGTKGQRGGSMNAAQVGKRAPDLEDPVQWEPEPPLEATQYVCTVQLVE